MFDALALSAIVLSWLFAGAIPWLVASVRSGGQAGFAGLVISCGAAVGAGLLVPALGLEGWTGYAASLGAALAGAIAGLLIYRRLFPRHIERQKA